MLWKKETERGNALYTNIFRLIGNEDKYEQDYLEYRNSNTQPIVNKSNEQAVKARMEGNKHFRNNNWGLAMVWYIESLRFAEEGSEHISLAYANRSTCFYHMKKYQECLIDIKLAREAGYPQHLMPKLDKREADCLKCIEEGATQHKSGMKLSFEPNKNFPCLANVLEFTHDENGNPSIVATKDIDVGQTIAVEKAFSAYVFDENFYRGLCTICLNEYTNLVPCKKCTVAMVCHDEFQHNSLHQHECGFRFDDENNVNGVVMRVARTIFLAIDLFPNVNDLMDFVEVAINSDPNEVPDTLSDAKSRYRAFLKRPFKELLDFYLPTYCTYKMLLEIPEINMIQTEQHQRFLMHLTCHHATILAIYSAKVETMNRGTIGFSNIGVIRRYFKLSCAPNTMPNTYKGNCGFITVRPIKKGELLTVSNFNPLLEPKEKREKEYEEYDYICKCARCEGVRLSPEQKKQLDMDPLYRSILLNNAAEHTDERVKSLVEKCETFLRKYGEFPWCEEIGRVIIIYAEVALILCEPDLSLTAKWSPHV